MPVSVALILATVVSMVFHATVGPTVTTVWQTEIVTGLMLDVREIKNALLYLRDLENGLGNVIAHFLWPSFAFTIVDSLIDLDKEKRE